ncbi:NADH-quinone oxidoreductase subunit L [Candidatus Kinetoplastidibacterium galati]|uniref:NADH dehydrogenase I subunit L n=1 Tax=Candidatus Kinetoplastidibacterium galati TCC219 TaxID=1208921 RepID=M1LYQ2_9PROT|nr:NADH-quinone oxidoreductase subunit L [Candidatus Kinetoplastibacterium galatii]AGF49196.1 NADH dehydrogenase I subunit L [Candidatus Kinetoplastibacterium galatii TCC219]
MNSYNPYNLCMVIVFSPLIGALISGFLGSSFLSTRPIISRSASSLISIFCILISFLSAIVLLYNVIQYRCSCNITLYTWSIIDTLKLDLGFLIDFLSTVMILVVTSVSLMVHIYTIGYMADDSGYQRFFSYISLFTFAMLMLVMSNNMLQLFFGWEAVGLVSYLLIGFWYTKESAVTANMKAFIVNRVGDFGFILGIGLLFFSTGSISYQDILSNIDFIQAKQVPGGSILQGLDLIPIACLCLFIGAMGKSAQVPLHAWLPDSMEGPTPISALIHAATMVTAGIFMVVRFSGLFELSSFVLSFIIITGSVGALFLGILGVIQTDIKRVVAYSTLSQLGYMTVALGVSAYSVAVFHLVTHAFFKALLFLGAGSVIIGTHHNQDIRSMGGIYKYMPVTWITFLLATLSLVGFPFFSGFYSKELIIESVKYSNIFGSGFAYFSVLTGVFITSLYSFRLYFLVFHGKERFRENSKFHGVPHEPGYTILFPLIFLSIPSVFLGLLVVDRFVFGQFFDSIITVMPIHDTVYKVSEEWHGWLSFAQHALFSIPFLLVLSGAFVSWYCYIINDNIANSMRSKFSLIFNILNNKYYFDIIYYGVAKFCLKLGSFLWKCCDQMLIDKILVNGSANLVNFMSRITQYLQSGFIYHYVVSMIIGIVSMVTIFVFIF